MSLGRLPLAAQLGEGFAQISRLLVLLMSGSAWYQMTLEGCFVPDLSHKIQKGLQVPKLPIKNNRSLTLPPVPVQVLSESGEWGDKGCLKHRR